jgi:hypothetical protein
MTTTTDTAEVVYDRNNWPWTRQPDGTYTTEHLGWPMYDHELAADLGPITTEPRHPLTPLTPTLSCTDGSDAHR